MIDTKIDHTWPAPPLADMPAGLTSLDHFSARWRGTLTAPEDGTYEIGVEGDDGYRLMLDGKTVVDEWNSGAARYRGAEIALRKGQTIPVAIEYYQGDGARKLRLAWRLPSEREAAARLAQAAQDLSVTTYLPQGAGWYDFWTNEHYAGGQRVTRQAPLDILPLYVRAGSIVPMGPVQHYATELPKAPYEIRIYPGADARFTVYEDDNETYDYEKGQYATYDLVWNDRARSLTISARKGSFPGLVQQRRLDLVLMTPRNATGAAPALAKRMVNYTGVATTVSFGR